jgi:hypothetical protein
MKSAPSTPIAQPLKENTKQKARIKTVNTGPEKEESLPLRRLFLK